MTNGEILLKKATDNLEWATRMMKESATFQSVDINRVVSELGAALRVRREERHAELAAAWYRRTNKDGETTERRHHPSREPATQTVERMKIGDEHALHIFKDGEGDDWCVWLNTPVSDFDGLVLALGPTRQQAVAHAVAVVEMIEAALQGPPVAFDGK